MAATILEVSFAKTYGMDEGNKSEHSEKVGALLHTYCRAKCTYLCVRGLDQVAARPLPCAVPEQERRTIVP